ncbi:phosphoribosylformylglycinamidine cyclo-ligase [Candidatus Peregrinibacteria bacterium]|nr:phosphoribosylformylglycinamidine cyclo-ligase [Candidatus Peregrinibacteria bacterium]
MLTYKKAGVDRRLGDLCSEIAYREAKKTFASRRGMIGEPLRMDGGFTGALDMGKFLLVQNEDGVGTKIEIAMRMGQFDTLGYDLVAMVADDAICVGAEVISITNTIDTSTLSKNVVSGLMKGLSKACREQKIVIPGGEIAELKGHVNGYTWNATAVGIVEKNKFIDGRTIRPGDEIIGIASPNFRSNGFTLLRAILKKAYGEKWHLRKFHGKRWGDITLAPSLVYHAGILSLIGRFGEKPRVRLKGIAHITGGGLPGNTPRMFGKQKFGLMLDQLPSPPAAMLELQHLGNISDSEVYETWNMGIGMVLVAENTKKALALLKKTGLKASVVGKVTKNSGIIIKTYSKKVLRY